MERSPGGDLGGTRSGGGNQTTEQAKQQTQQIARQARQQASQLANRGSEQVKSQLANQKHQAAQRMTPLQTALRETAHQLRSQGQDPIAQYADRATDQLERLSGYLRETDVDEIIDEVRSFARGRPGLFLGGAAALGFLATRFLKSSSQEEQEDGGSEEGSGYRAISGEEEPHRVQEVPYQVREEGYSPTRPGPPAVEVEEAVGQPISDQGEPIGRQQPTGAGERERTQRHRDRREKYSWRAGTTARSARSSRGLPKGPVSGWARRWPWPRPRSARRLGEPAGMWASWPPGER